MSVTKTCKRSLFSTTIIAVAFCSASAFAADRVIPEIEWNTKLNHFQVDNDKYIGQRLSLKCPPRSVRDTDEAIQGTDVYPSDNPICVAATHAGAVTADGGVVTVQLNPALDGFKGSERNGIVSSDLPGKPRSMVFIKEPDADADAIQTKYLQRLDWDAKFTRTGLANKELVGQRFAFNCPAAPGDMIDRRVVGTDSYAFDSMICRAAVHAGKITKDGGVVLVQMDPGMKDLIGSIRNGIETKNGSSVVRTISFVDDAE